MRANQARSISIPQYLERIEGLTPAHSRLNGKELWYKSPIRSSDSTPSFKVDSELNLFFDHGISKGGNVIDLVCAIRNVSVKQALSILDHSGLYQGGYSSQKIRPSQKTALFKNNTVEMPAGEKEKSPSAMTLLSITAIENTALLDYLAFRKIDLNIAQKYLKEIRFQAANNTKTYYALGWPNGNGFEARNKYFKGFVGTGKTISALNIKNGADLLIFEGFMDYLSYLSLLKTKGITDIEASVVVLNSTSLKKQLLQLLENHTFKSLYFFLDNDEAGRETMAYFTENLADLSVVDKSSLYTGYNDFNAKMMDR